MANGNGWFFREYLNDFKRNAAGQYVYTGKVFAFCGEARQKKHFLIKTAVLSLLAAALTVLPECFKPVDISRSFITVLPWLAQLIAVFLTAWASIRLIIRINDLKKYVYAKTAAALPRRSVISAALSGFTAVVQIIYIIVNGFGEEPVFTALHPACSFVCAGVCFLLYKTARAASFKAVS